ncbi:MAG: PAS domain S-box protein [Methanoregula sp.]|nr:PAS domain S-box protein [Methanoregula sp.]
MNRNSAAKYLEILQISGQVESKTYGMARVFFLTHRLPISALVSIASDLVVTLDENYRIIFVNKGFCDLFSVQKDDVAGIHIVDIFKTGIGCDILPGVFSDVIADPDKVHEVSLKQDSSEIFFKIKSMKTVFDDGSRGITIIMEDVTRETKARIELEIKESRYRGIVEDQIEYVIRFLPDGTLSFVNTSYSRFLKKRSEDLLGTQFSDMIHPQDQKVFDRCLSSLNRKNPVATVECRTAVSVRPVRWIAWTLRAMYDHKKDPVEYQVVGNDITEKKEAAEEIQQQVTQMEFFSKKLEEFIELPPGADIYRTIGTGLSEILPIAAICVSSYDPGTTTMTIKAVCTEQDRDIFNQYIGRDIIGLKVPIGDAPRSADFLSGRIISWPTNLYEIICHQVPEDTCGAIEKALNLEKFYTAGLIWQGALLGNVTFALRNGEQLGNISLAETYVRAASIVLQRSIAENALRESENLYRTVIENIQDVFYRADMDGNLVMASPSWAKLLGYASLDEVPGRNIARDLYLEPHKREAFLAAITKKGLVRNFEVVLKKKDGTPLYVLATSNIYYDKDGTPLGIEGILHDISDRKAAEKKIHQYIGEMEFLSQKLQDFIMMSPSENIYGKILSDLKNLVPGAMILVNSFDPQTGILTVKNAAMSEPQREAIFRALGRDLVGSEFLVDSAGLSVFRTGRLQKAKQRLFDIAFRTIPEPVCDRLESELEIGEVFGIGFIRQNEIMGNASIFLTRGASIPNISLIEMYAHQAAIALRRYTAEEARRKSDEIFANIAQYSPLPIVLVGPDDTYLYINESFIRLFGYTLNDFHTVEEWLTLVCMDPVYRKKMIESCKSEHEKFRPGYSFTKMYQTRCKDSTVRDIIVRSVVLSDMNICMICEDITERNKAEQNNRLLSSIITSTNDAVIAKGNQGTIISWNKAAEQLYGYSEDEIIGQNISRIIPLDRTEEMAEIFSRIRRGESVSNLETRRIRKDGGLIDVSVTISPLTDNAGNVTGASTIARDISPGKAEQRLREKEDQHRLQIENISVGVYRSTGDPAGHFIWGNPSLVKILGYPSFDHLKEVDIAGIFVDSDGRKKLLSELKKDGFVKNREIALKRADGETISVLVTAVARYDTGGGLSCINGIVEDITSQRTAEQRTQVVTKEMHDILSFIQDPIVVVDRKNTVVAWNAAM